MSTKVYKYGVIHCPKQGHAHSDKHPQIQGLHIIQGEMSKAHKYKNKLIEIERSRRAARKARLLEVDPVYAELERQYEEQDALVTSLIEQLNAKRAAARERIRDPELEQQIRAAKARRKELGEQRTAQRQALLYELCPEFARLDPLWRAAKEGLTLPQVRERAAQDAAFAALQEGYKAAYKEADAAIYGEVEEEHAELARKARKESGLDWGTYQMVEEAFQDIRMTSKGDPKFRRWEGHGSVAIHIQGSPLTVEDMFEQKSNFLRCERPPSEAFEKAPGWQKLQRVQLHFRVQSEKRKPIWAVLPVRLHRPLPPDAKITWCKIFQHRIGANYQYEVQFTLSLEPDQPSDRAAAGKVGIDVGYRRLPEGLRVAYWCGDDGAEEQLLLPERILAIQAKTRDLQSIRDKNFDAHKLMLSNWMKHKEKLPEWLSEQAATVSQWRSTGRLAVLMLRWREQRFAGDEDIFRTLEAWRQQDKHLLNWQQYEQRGVILFRKNLYREFAAEMRRKYAKAYIEDLDVRALLRAPLPEEEGEDGGIRYHQRLASLGELLSTLQEFGPECQKVESYDTTRKCNICGHINSWADQSSQALTCEGCGETWDQDKNAARNILREGE